MVDSGRIETPGILRPRKTGDDLPPAGGHGRRNCREFAHRLGIPKAWEQTSTRTNILHYDLTRQCPRAGRAQRGAGGARVMTTHISSAEWRALRESPVDNPTPEAVRVAVKVHLRDVARRARASMQEDDKLQARCRKLISRFRPKS